MRDVVGNLFRRLGMVGAIVLASALIFGAIAGGVIVHRIDTNPSASSEQGQGAEQGDKAEQSNKSQGQAMKQKNANSNGQKNSSNSKETSKETEDKDA